MANYSNGILQSTPNQYRKTTIYYQKTTSAKNSHSYNKSNNRLVFTRRFTME